MVYAFDLDDTLYTEFDFVRSGYKTVASYLSDTSNVDLDTYYHGIWHHRPLGFEWALELYINNNGSDAAMSVDKMIEMYRAHKPDICLRQGVVEMLERLKSRGNKLVLITDGSTQHQRSKINALGLDKYFDDILISEETGGDKTTDIPWDIVVKKYGCPGQRFFYIGDNLSKDFLLPRSRGWQTIMVLDVDGVNVFKQQIDSWPPQNLPGSIVTVFDSIE